MTTATCPSSARRDAALGLLLATALAAPAAAEVAIAADTAAGVDLDSLADGTVSVAAGVSVSAPLAVPAVSGTLAAWALTNRGTITGYYATGVRLSVAGSSVLNYGTVTTNSNAVLLAGGGSVTNAAGATLSAGNSAISIGTSGGGAGEVTNSGTITQTGTAGDLVALRYGGKVTNLAGGVIAAANGSNAVSVGQGAMREVENWGTISNTYAGGGYPAGVLLQGGASTLTNHAGGTVSGTLNGVYASASAYLTLVNDGSIQSTGAGASARAAELAGGGEVTNHGTIASLSGDGLYLGRAGTVLNTGTITGAVRAISFAGTYARTLTLGTGSVLNGLVQGGSGTDALVLQGTGAEDISKFLAFETLAMQGEAWTLSGAGSFATSGTVGAGVLTVTGTLTLPQLAVTDGRLAVTGTVAGAVTAGSGGTVGGTGSLAALQVASGGTVAPGGSGPAALAVSGGGDMATLTVTGDAGFAEGSAYRVDVDAAGGSDLLAVGGAAALAGGTVAVQAAAGNYAAETDYTILTAAGGVSGAFGDATSSLAFLTPELSYTATAVQLRLTRNGLDFAGVGGTFNQRATGAAVEAAGAGNAAYDAVLMLDVPGARTAFDQLSGEIHATLWTALIEDSRLPREVALARLRDPAAAGVTGWAMAYGSDGRWPGDGNAGAVSRRAAGLIGGVETALDSGARLGALAGWGRASFALGSRAASGDAGTAVLGLYGGQSWGAWSLRGGLAYARHDIGTLRRPAFSGFADRLEAGYGGHTAQGFVELGYALQAGGWTLEPFVSLAGVALSTPAFAETGGDGALAGRAGRMRATVTTLGLHYAADLPAGRAGRQTGGKAHLTGLLGWRHVAGDTLPEAGLTLDGGPAFAIRGVPALRDAVLAEVNLTLDLSPHSSLTVGLSGLHGAGLHGAGGSDGRLSVAFAAAF